MWIRQLIIVGIGIINLFGMSVMAQTPASPLLQKSEEAFNAERWKSAGTLYELLLKDSTSYTPYMAKALLANELAADEASLRKADLLYQQNRFRLDSLLHDFSRLCIRLRHFDAFEESLNRIRTVMPENNDTLLYGMIRYRMFLRDAPGAIRLTEKARIEQPAKSLWIRLEAEAWQMAGKSDKALGLYRLLLSLNPNDLDALLFEGNYYYLLGKKKIAQLEKEQEQPLGNSRSQYNTYYQQLKEIQETDFARAIEFLEKANEMRANTTVTHTLYEMYVLKSEVEKANKMKKRL